MIKRELSRTVLSALSEAPAVCLVGPRQAGKTTLALEVAADIGGQYLDLESETDRAKLANPGRPRGRPCVYAFFVLLEISADSSSPMEPF